MSENLASFTARLETLLGQIMHEKNPVTFDDLCSQLRQVLDEHERLADSESRTAKADKTAA